MSVLPDRIETEEELNDVLCRPTPQLISDIRSLESPLVILGAGGKMGPTLAVLAKRAAAAAGHPLRVVAASRFGDPTAREWLEAREVETVAANVFDRPQLESLPDSSNVVYLVGMKFGTANDPVPTWATNTVGPVLAGERYGGSKIVALSTGNVYALSPVASGGSGESDPLTPIGEYANAAVARERVFQYYARSHETPTALIRLNYAHDLRYGVLSDIAHKVWKGQTIDLTMGHFNAIWQGDANELILRAFALCGTPAQPINLTGPEVLSVREMAERLGELMGRQPLFQGSEASTALLSNTAYLQDRFGTPHVDIDRMLAWIAHWTVAGGPTLGKPTHFETRDGKY